MRVRTGRTLGKQTWMLCKSSSVDPTIMKIVQDIHLSNLRKIHESRSGNSNTHVVFVVKGGRNRARGPGGDDTFDFGL